ncbi:DUF6531 domain-containing protein [Amycolatopsis aidingensis]|uniref:DUF6531 domain-containing protein n=1 Tax=Amycolatopsis aidingensis TaxID=2842453 RepID=UPI001C0BD2F5|nr:DUF6531 domain-containing protein [Amycolatopsis aidingensis]
MPEGNPLVAEAQSQTTAVTGIGIAESATDLANGVSDGSWVEAGLGAVGTGLEVLSLVVDPVGTLLQYGVSWLIEHVEPLKEALDWLAGDPPVIQSFSDTWANVAAEVKAIAGDLGNEANNGTAGWTGDGADAYRGAAAEQADAIAGAATLADGISAGVMIMGTVVAAVREIVRDLVAELVGKLITWALEAAGTLGFATPLIAVQATTAITKAINRISELIRKLVKTIGNVTPRIRKIVDKLGEIIEKLAKLGRKIGGGGSTTPSGVDAPKVDTPTVKSPDGGTTPSSATSPSGTTVADPPSAGSKPDGTAPSSSSPDGTGTTGPSGRSPDGRPRQDGDSVRTEVDKDPKGKSAQEDKRVCKDDPIDVVSGEMVMAQTDVALTGVLPLLVNRTHVSSYRVGRRFGRSWASTLDQRLEIEGDGLYFAAEDGALLAYPTPPDTAEPVYPREGARWPLSRAEGGGYRILDPEDGRILRFGAPRDEGNGVTVAPLVAVANRAGDEVEFRYDGAGTPTELRHTGGYRVLVDTDAGLVTGLRLHDGHGQDIVLARYRYDDARRLVEVLNSSEQAMRFSYDPAGRITRWEDRNGHWYSYTYDGEGRCVRTEGSGGYLAGTFEYDRAQRITTHTDSLGAVTTYHMNERNQIVREVDPLGGVIRREWAHHDQLLSYVDQLGNTTRFEYDEAGNVTAITYPDGARALAEYNELNLPTSVTEPDGACWRHEYDERGRRTATIDPLGGVSRFEYDERGHLAAVTDELGSTRRIDNDPAGLPVRVTDPFGAVTSFTRDAFGRPAMVTDPLGCVTRLGWTVEGRPAWRVTPDGATERWSHDAEGNQVTFTDAMGQTTRTVFTHLDLPVTQIGPDGSRTEFGYDTEMRLTSVTDPRGHTWHYGYDAAGRLVREVDFNGRNLSYAYDPAGALTARTNGAGQTVRLVRDARGNIVRRENDSGSATTFEYDPAGRMRRAANADAEVVMEYDALGRVTSESVNGRVVASGYDAVGRKVSRRTPAGAHSRWDYDAGSRPVALHSAGRVLTFGYDPAGREIERLLDTGTVLAQTWDRGGRLQAQTVSTVATAMTGPARQPRLIERRSYGYRADGMLATIEDRLAGARTFDLDSAGRVTAVRGPRWAEQYAYDAAGQLTSGSWPGGGDTQGMREYEGTLLRQAGNVRYSYDAQGRVVLRQRKRLSAKPDTWRYEWDAEDRLTSVTTPEGTRWRYRYDPLGRRIAKQRLAADGTVAEQVDFTWDGTTLVEQADSTGSTITWDWHPDGTEVVAQVERRSARNAPQEWIDERFYSIISDHLGAPAEMLDTGGNPVWRSQASLWGEHVGSGQAAGPMPLRFPGQYFDSESGLSYNYFRYYDASTGRYQSNDPLGLLGGPNPHGYVGNPLELVDPLGLMGKKKKGKCTHEIFERYGSQAEADSAREAGNKLTPKPEPHHRNPKWIGDQGTVDPRTLGQAKNYTHKLEIHAEQGTRAWLKEQGFELKPTNEPGRYAVSAEKLEEFNSKVKDIVITRIRK